MGNPSAEPAQRRERFRFRWLVLWAVSMLICIPTIIVLFYAVENWRGKRAWENYKKELEAKGESLDLDAFLPATIPDDENVLRAPVMARLLDRQWRPRPLRVPESGILVADLANARPSDLPEWNELFSILNATPVLATGFPAPPFTNTLSGGEVMPLIAIEDAPLQDAIHTLARQGDIRYRISPDVEKSHAFDTSVTIRFENVTARQALVAVLDNHGLRMIPSRTNSQLFEVVAHGMDIIAELTAKEESKPSAERVYSRAELKDAVLTNAIQYFAEESGLTFQFEALAWREFETKASSHGIQTTRVSARWEDLTAQEVLENILETHSLTMSTNMEGHFELRFQPRTAVEILDDLKQFSAEFEEIHEACARPKAKFDSDYKNLSKREFPNFSAMRVIAQSLSLRASVQLALDKNEGALRDIQDCIRLADCFTNEPTLVGGMMRVAFDGIIISPIWEGLAARRWNEQQLLELQQRLERIDLLSSTIRSIRAERANETYAFIHSSPDELSKSLGYSWLNSEEEQSRRLLRLAIHYVPNGWIFQSIALMNRLHQENHLDLVDLKQSMVPPQKIEAAKNRTQEGFKSIRPGNFLASIAYSSFSKGLKSTAQNQTLINEAIIACALERYRLARGSFPDKLEALAPQFLTRIPHDLINGQPLKYHVAKDDRYVLYSVAWDEKDDDGLPTPQTFKEEETGDWVWRFPAKRTATASALH